MSKHGHDILTVSPGRLDQTAFARLDAGLPAPHAPFARDWLMGRLRDGMQLRLLRRPQEGFVLFQPGKLAWRPILGAERAVVVHDLRVAEGPNAREAALRLWREVEDFAQYFGFPLVLALLGRGAGLIAPERAPGRGWMTLDHGPDGVRLVGRVLHGPVPLPRLPRDWVARAEAAGPGIVIRTSGESVLLERRAEALVAMLAPRGIAISHRPARDAAEMRAQALCPGAAYGVSCAGRYLGGPELGPDEVLRAALGASAPAQSPS